MMKAKAEAEAKQMQAQGLKRGEDFLDCKSNLTAGFLRCLVFLSLCGFFCSSSPFLFLFFERRAEGTSKHARRG